MATMQPAARAAARTASRTRPSRIHVAWTPWRTSAAFALAYFVVGYLGRLTVVDGSPLALVFPASGVAVVWFLVTGARALSRDAVLLGVAVLAFSLATDAPLDLALTGIATNLLQTVLTTSLLRRWCSDMWRCGGVRDLDSPRLVGGLLGATTAGMAAGAVLGSALLTIEDLDLDLDAVVVALWFGRNLCGGLGVLVLVLLIDQRRSLARRQQLVAPTGDPAAAGMSPRLVAEAATIISADGPQLERRAQVELALVAIITVAVYAFAFEHGELPLVFSLLAVTAWVGTRFPTLISVSHSSVVGVATVTFTLAGVGPFAAVDNPQQGALLAQAFVVTILVTGLVLGVQRDESLALAQALHHAEAGAAYRASLLDAVVGSMKEGIAVVDDQGEFQFVNRAGHGLVDHDHDGEIDPTSVPGIGDFGVDGQNVPAALRPLARALSGDTVGEIDLEPTRGSSRRIFTVSAAPLPADDALERRRALLVFADATSDRAHRAELLSFAGVVAHDLRNPLAAVDGWTDLLAEKVEMIEASGGDTVPVRDVTQVLSRVTSASGRMHGLIADLLIHASSRDRELKPVPLDLADVVWRTIGERFRDATIDVRPLPTVAGDPVLVGQLLDNLIGNAVKYVAHDTRPHVVIDTDPDHVGESTARVRVTDNGIGIPDAERSKVFDEFHRVHAADYPGSGLGLAICRRIVERHGGRIEALPGADGGTTMAFTLPLAASA